MGVMNVGLVTFGLVTVGVVKVGVMTLGLETVGVVRVWGDDSKIQINFNLLCAMTQLGISVITPSLKSAITPTVTNAVELSLSLYLLSLLQLSLTYCHYPHYCH